MRSNSTTPNCICLHCGNPFRTKPCLSSGIRKYCSRNCYWNSKVGKPVLEFEPDEVRFWKRVQKGAGCWLWTGHLGASGYGGFHANGTNIPAHKYSYELHYGYVTPGNLVCHKCEPLYIPGDITYRRCVRPDHLYQGTAADNVDDRERSGRANHPFGEGHTNTKLSSAAVTQIREIYAGGGATYKELALRFDVSASLVSHIVTGLVRKRG